ncbi:hypothetical protein JCM16303_002441 [Sporobolomyces ruberrimus]
MTTSHTVIIHTRVPHDTDSLPHPLEPSHSAIRELVQPTQEPRTSYSCSPWNKHKPIRQTPNTRAYTTSTPVDLKNLRPRGRSPSPEDWKLPEFRHWVRPTVREEGMSPRKRTLGTEPTVGAWNTTTDETSRGEKETGVYEQKKEKKRVRVESPATTTTRQRVAVKLEDASMAESETTKRRSTRNAESSTVENASLRRSPRTRKANAKELVPATPEDAETDTTAVEAPELAVGAIERCIPPPYHHIVQHDHPPRNYPTRQEPARILHSFVDPSYSPTSSTSSASLNRTSVADLSSVSPLTSEYLIPGRQGSWLIPVSGSFVQLPRVSPPVWYSRPPPPRLPTTTNRNLQRVSSVITTSPKPIEWTSARLTALWSVLTKFHESSAFGPLRAICHIPPRHASMSLGTMKDGTQLPEYVKITIDANLALAFRSLLSLITVAKAPSSSTTSVATTASAQKKGGKGNEREKLKEKETNVETRGKGKEVVEEEEERAKGIAKEVEKDEEKWLKGRALLWVDESGRAILLA